MLRGPRTVSFLARGNLSYLQRRGVTNFVSRNALSLSLKDADPEAYHVLKQYLESRNSTLNLMAGENYATTAVLQEIQAPFHGNEAEGYPGTRHAGGSYWIDEMEKLCQRRALQAFGLNRNEWGVNVQPLSGSLANLYTFAAILQPGDTVMGLDMNHGGHISHGYQTERQKISDTAYRYNVVPYHIHEHTGLIDYDSLEVKAKENKPKLIIAGASAYSRLIEYERIRDIADSVGATLMSDISHICGPIAAGLIPSPFEQSDIVTTTTYKTIRGPPSALIYAKTPLIKAIDRSVFPRFQCGSNTRHMLGMATALLQATLPETIAQQRVILEGAKALSKRLLEKGYRLIGGGTDIHLVVLDLRGSGIDGTCVERVLELCGINANRNVIAGEKPGSRSGVRFGTPPMVSRGFCSADFEWLGDIIHRAICIAATVCEEMKISSSGQLEGQRMYQAFYRLLGDGSKVSELTKLREEVLAKALKHPVPL